MGSVLLCKGTTLCPQGWQGSSIAPLPPQLSLTCALAGLFLYLFSLRPLRKTSPGRVLPVLQSVFGLVVSGGNWRCPGRPKLPSQTLPGPLPSPPKLCRRCCSLLPKGKTKCFSDQKILLKAGMQRKKGWP